MKRIVGLVVAGLLVAVAIRLPTPTTTEPLIDATGALEAASPGVSRFAHCPWALADGIRRSVYVAVSEDPTGLELSFLEGGTVAESLSGEVARDAVARIDNPRVMGTSSALVEFSESPGSVGVVAIGENLLAGDLCSGAVPPTWHLPGGSTLEGESLTLRLFNPFTTDARVDLWAFSELGTEAGDALEGLNVPAKRTRIVVLDEMMAGRESLAIIVRPSFGSVIPVMVLDNGADAAFWPGTGTSEGWEFPVADVEGLETWLVLTNEASIGVNFLVEAFDESGPIEAPMSGTIDGPGQVRVPLGRIAASGFGIRVTGDGPFGAVLVGRSETAIAATVGAPTNADAWLVPGPRAVPATTRLRLLNAGVVDLNVAYTMLTTQGGKSSDAVNLAPGAVHTFAVTGPDVAGVLVWGSGPFSVGWWAESDGRAMFGGAAPLE